MDLGNAIKRAGRDDITIRSVIANTIQELYPRNVSITSVKISGNTILIKTWNPLINSELQMMKWELENLSREKLNKMWIPLDRGTMIKFL